MPERNAGYEVAGSAGRQHAFDRFGDEVRDRIQRAGTFDPIDHAVQGLPPSGEGVAVGSHAPWLPVFGQK